MNDHRTFVTFDADLPDDAEWNDDGDMLIPGGRAITEALTSALELHGCDCSDIYQHSHYGWTFDATCGSVTCRYVLAAAETEWLLQMTPKRSLVGFLTRQFDADKLRESQQCVHDALNNEKRFSQILWYTRQDYENCRNDLANPVPYDDPGSG